MNFRLWDGMIVIIVDALVDEVLADLEPLAQEKNINTDWKM